jgi:hypothetical protein
MTPVTRFWLALALVVAAVLFHALFPRYTITPNPAGGASAYRVDRWSGTAEVAYFTTNGSQAAWLTLHRGID